MWPKGKEAWNKGLNKDTDARMARLSQSMTNREITWGDKISQSCKGRIPWNKGLTKETDSRVAQVSATLTGRDITWGNKISDNRKGLGGEAQSILKKQIPCQIAGWNKGLPAWNRGLTKETSISMAKVSEAQLAHWQDPKWVAHFLECVAISPNKSELLLLDILNSYFPNEWEYVGDGGIVIGGKIPDFVNVNGKKQIIELFGDYWHKDDDPQKRINSFMHFGYATIVIWESELKDIETVVTKVKQIPSVETIHGAYLSSQERMKRESATP